MYPLSPPHFIPRPTPDQQLLFEAAGVSLIDEGQPGVECVLPAGWKLVFYHGMKNLIVDERNMIWCIVAIDRFTLFIQPNPMYRLVDGHPVFDS